MRYLNVEPLNRRTFTSIERAFSLSGEALPFSVIRTVNGELPVYKIYRNNGKVVNSVIKHVRGDVNEFRKAVANVCESPVKLHMGSVEVRGIHTWKVKEYLESIGL